ncbi:MAG: adenylate/guanylate cyclase domain-containing protein [Deltaproteobacteria bacterium]|nr:adenylate/guanylate cyclase domain-containing protein [Candidatus Zymogenaceae bacterium]
MKKITGIIIGILISILVIFLGRFGFGFIPVIENKILDYRFLLRGKMTPGDEVVIIAIDEKTLDEVGRWPFPRSYFVDVVENLNKMGIRAVGFDMVFSEPDIYSGISTIDYIKRQGQQQGFTDPKLLEFYDETRDRLDNDDRLAHALSQTPGVILGYFFHVKQKDIQHMSEPDIEKSLTDIGTSRYRLISYDSEEAKRVSFFEMIAPETNIPVISRAAEGFGYFNVFPDGDGTIRWSPLAVKCRDTLYPSFALELSRAYLKAPAPDIYISEDGVYKVVIGDIEIPTNAKGELLINYRGPVRTFPYYSFVDILKGRVDKEKINGRIAVIGTSAVGTYDLRVTPIGSDFPGTEINATIIDNILHRRFISMPAWVQYLDFLVVLLFGILLGLIIPRVSAWFGAVIGVVMTGGWIMFTQYMFANKNIWIAVLPPLLTIAVGYTVLNLIRYITVERTGKQIREAFQYYVPELVVHEILKNPSMLTLGGDRKEITVLFSDIKGFTSLSEELSPEDLVNILNEYLSAMTDVVFSHRGLLDKYIGDAIMAVYGAPLPQPDHPMQACMTALDMIAELDRLMVRWKAMGRPALSIRIGINTGFAAVGNMGSKKRFDYTVMGDAVNLASRLENLNKQYETTCLVTEYTYRRVADAISFRELDLVRVRGKNIPEKIYEMIGKKGQFPDREAAAGQFEHGLALVRSQRWEDAFRIFEALKKELADDVPIRLYLSRIEKALADPPPADWDGVFLS